METSIFQKLLAYLRQIFRAKSNTPEYIPPSTGSKKTSESGARTAPIAREAKAKPGGSAKTDTDPRRHPSENFSSESQAYKNFR